MAKLPSHIKNALLKNHTSLGEHPALPPEDEEKFLVHIVSKKFNELTAKFDGSQTDALLHKLSKSITQCQKIESKNKESLEKLVADIVVDLLQIPDDVLELTVELKDVVDTSQERQFPEKTDGFSFDDIDDINYLSAEIYKRRMLNALISGIAQKYSADVSAYVSDLFKIDSQLPSLIQSISNINQLMLYIIPDEDANDDKKTTSGGKTSVMIGGKDNMVTIECEGIIFLTLLYESIKGVLELAIAHGLPKDKNKAEYVMKKADFRFADLWDMRLGLPLWERIEQCTDDSEQSIEKVGLMYFMMELASLPTDEFNRFMQEVLAHTKKGKRMLTDMLSDIDYNKGEEEFNDYINSQSSLEYDTDDRYFSPDELNDIF